MDGTTRTDGAARTRTPSRSCAPSPLTLFAIPKAFEGHDGVIQTNAIMSWARLVRPAAIALCGRDAGVEEMAARIGAQHVPDIRLSDHGTPLVSDAFARVSAEATTPWVCYVNADIMLTGGLALAATRLRADTPTLLVGQRVDADVTAPLDLDAPDAEARLRGLASDQGEPSHRNAIDYFCFTPGDWLRGMPPFIVGRPGWDNWFIHNALRRGVRVVDATADVLALHQNHGYDHVPARTGHAWEGPEAVHNRSQIASYLDYCTLDDATHRLVRGRLRPALGYRYLRSRLRRRWAQRSRVVSRAMLFGVWLAKYYVLGPMKMVVTGKPRRPGGRPRWSPAAKSRGS